MHFGMLSDAFSCVKFSPAEVANIARVGTLVHKQDRNEADGGAELE
jgi:hypothetical protein